MDTICCQCQKQIIDKPVIFDEKRYHKFVFMETKFVKIKCDCCNALILINEEVLRPPGKFTIWLAGSSI